MSVIVTRGIQIVCVLAVALSLFAIAGSNFNPEVMNAGALVIGFSIMIFLLATILRVVSDAAEKVLFSLGYRKEEKATAAAAVRN